MKNSIFPQEELEVLTHLLETNTPSGYEKQIITFIKNEFKGKNIYTDIIGNLYIHAGKGAHKVMITAHCDEVGFQITSIDDAGFAYARKLGGLDRHTIPGTKVIVVDAEEEIVGVFGKKSPHVQTPEEREKILELDDLWVDFGYSSKEEALKHVKPGNYLTAFNTPLFINNNKRVVSKGLDNKVSVFILLETMKKLTEMKLGIEVVGVATVQEEIGCRGSIVAAQKMKPDYAFCLDVGIATDIPSSLERKYGAFSLGKGPGICKNPDNNEKIERMLLSVASNNKIAHQHVIGFRPTGGTETAKIQLLSEGVVTANISIPNRYMHSVVEMCDLSDIANTIELLVSAIKELENKEPEEFCLF